MIKDFDDPDTLYTKVTALKILDHLTEFCAGLHTVDAVDIPQVMKSLYKDSEGVFQFINAMEAAQRKSNCAKLVINDEYLHTVALKSLLQSGEYETETWEWPKAPENNKPGRTGKPRFARHMSPRDDQKLLERENRNLSEVLHYLVWRLSKNNSQNRRNLHKYCTRC